jgi:hypothetical protein
MRLPSSVLDFYIAVLACPADDVEPNSKSMHIHRDRVRLCAIGCYHSKPPKSTTGPQWSTESRLMVQVFAATVSHSSVWISAITAICSALECPVREGCCPTASEQADTICHNQLVVPLPEGNPPLRRRCPHRQPADRTALVTTTNRIFIYSSNIACVCQ